MKLSKTLSFVATLALAPVMLMAAPATKAKEAAKKPVAVAAAPVALKSSAASVVKVLGDSTLHKWDAKATELTITAELGDGKTGTLFEQVKAGALTKLELAINVIGLKSNEGKSMDKNMHKALDADTFGAITFSLKSYTVAGDEVTAKGALTIHGITKDVDLKGKLVAKGEGIQVTGQFDSLMNDWGVKPPVMMLGTVRVADKISIAYDYDLAK